MDRDMLKDVHEILPNQRTVSLTPQAGGSSIPVEGAIRRPWTHRDMQAAGQLTIPTDSATFLLPLATLGAIVPAQRWKITDDEGYTWSIVSGVTRELEGTMFRCICIQDIPD